MPKTLISKGGWRLWKLSWLVLAAYLGLIACDYRGAPIVVSPAGLCWPLESDAAYAEFVANCAADGSLCPGTKEWRQRLALLKAQLPTCSVGE